MEVAERLQHTYENTKSITAVFSQVTTIAMSRRVRKGAGNMTLLKPGKLRWDYHTPDKQVIVCDGKKFFMYFAKNKQMLIAKATDYIKSDVTYSFFTGAGNITRDFEVMPPDQDIPFPQNGSSTTIQEEDLALEDSHVIKLVPKQPHPQVDYLHLWVDTTSFLIRRLLIVDQFGSITDLQFRDISINPTISEKLFSYTPPPDTEIIEN